MTQFSMLINGELAASSKGFDVINPADESIICQAPDASDQHLDKAVNAAQCAFPQWSQTSFRERGEVLRAIAAVIKQNAAELIDILVTEQGKPKALATGEVLMAANGLETKSTMQISPEVLKDDAESRVELHHRPLGIVAAIAPWNFPLGIGISKFANPLMAGCPVVLKPSPNTPLSTLRLGELIKDVVPKGVLNIISGGDSLGPKLTAHSGIAKIFFTGSTQTGKKIMQGAGQDLKRITLELGGNDAAIVLEDADIAKIAQPLFQACFINSGQTCVAIKRVYVHESMYEPLVGALAAIAKKTKVGPGMEPDSQLGPIQNRMQYEKVLSVLEEVKKTDARIVAGGSPSSGKGFFLDPTIVTNIKEGSCLVDEETFGPILPIIAYRDLDEVIDRANDTAYGLGGSVWGNDVERATEVAGRLNCGTAWVNQHLVFGPNIPFGGAKQSGIGVEGGIEGLKEFTQAQVLNIKK